MKHSYGCFNGATSSSSLLNVDLLLLRWTVCKELRIITQEKGSLERQEKVQDVVEVSSCWCAGTLIHG